MVRYACLTCILITRDYKIFSFIYSKKFKGKTLLKISKKLSNRYNSERRVTSGQRINGDALKRTSIYLDTILSLLEI